MPATSIANPVGARRYDRQYMLKSGKIEYVHNEQFELRGARRKFIAELPVMPLSDENVKRLSRDDEYLLFSNMNYAKFKYNLVLDWASPNVDELNKWRNIFEYYEEYITRHNIPLLTNLVQKTIAQYSYHDTISDDLESFGRLGLYNAVRKFNASYGWKFSTFAYTAIRRNLYKEMRLANKRVTNFCSFMPEYDRGCRDKDIDISDAKHDIGMLVVQNAVGLSDIERRVLMGRYGIGDDIPKKLHELGDIVGVTKERIRQIELSALNKVRKYISELSPDKVEQE